jgi:8-oxo-dGTP pyrophosphatase MutT (NUDIX family)
MVEDHEPENPWRIVEQQTVYENSWIRLIHHEVIRPDGAPGIYGVVHFRHRAVGILPIDAAGHTWLVGQYRFPLADYSWEIPEGGCPEGEEPLAAAQRELREETGLSAATWQTLGEAHLSNSVSDERAILYLATGLSRHAPAPEGTEVLTIRHLPFDEALQMVLTGRITDAMSVMAILLYDRRRHGSPGSSGDY